MNNFAGALLLHTLLLSLLLTQKKIKKVAPLLLMIAEEKVNLAKLNGELQSTKVFVVPNNRA